MKELTSNEIKQIELEILIEFDKFCKKNNITYFLCGGTLLGAIRHKGFIPWDDDIDVFMPRPDFENFKALTRENPLKENLKTFCYDINGAEINYPFMKVIDLTTKVSEKSISEGSSGIWIDVFPLDGLSDSEKENLKLFKKNKFYKREFRFMTNDTTYTKNVIKKILLLLTSPIYKNIDILKFCRKMDYQAKSLDWEKSNNIGGLLWGYGICELMPKNQLYPAVEVEFENHKFPAPNCWDLYLKNLYGNYMQLPPEEKRVYHGFTAYKLDD